MNDKCPKCGSDNILKLRRVTGYLSSDYRNFNLGKQDEVDDRVKHINN
jgi:ribonucleoside-triphosphate reductase